MYTVPSVPEKTRFCLRERLLAESVCCLKNETPTNILARHYDFYIKPNQILIDLIIQINHKVDYFILNSRDQGTYLRKSSYRSQCGYQFQAQRAAPGSVWIAHPEGADPEQPCLERGIQIMTLISFSSTPMSPYFQHIQP